MPRAIPHPAMTAWLVSISGWVAGQAIEPPELDDSFPGSVVADRSELFNGRLLARGVSGVEVMRTGELTPGEVERFVLTDTGLAPGDLFYAFTDNSESGVDTLLTDWVTVNDDSGPVGTGTASALIGNVNAAGEVVLEVSGFGDDLFAGDHDESGVFTLLVDTNGFLTITSGDVDFVTFEGLLAGFFYRVTLSSFIPLRVGVFDETGELLGSEIEPFGQAAFVIRSRAGGRAVLGVTGVSDVGFAGAHGQVGVYTLAVTPECVQDFTEPMGVIDEADAGVFFGKFAAQAESAEFADPVGTIDFFDVAGFGQLADFGCE